MEENILKEMNALETDQERWEWVIANKGNGIVVRLDNDDTFVTLSDEFEEDYDEYYDEDEDYEEEITSVSFDSYIGNSHGVVELLSILEIPCEHV